jgi:transcriptional antiterminator RfaH
MRWAAEMGEQLRQTDACGAPWVAINTHPHSEHLALENLHRQKFEAYCPMLRRQRSHARRIDTVLRPLFPNYLFVRIDKWQATWRPILSTYGVRTVVRTGDELSFIEDAFVASLKAREIGGAIVRPATPYQVGQQVQIATGSFNGLVATIIDMDEKDRLVVLLGLMNRGIKVHVRSECVSPA